MLKANIAAVDALCSQRIPLKRLARTPPTGLLQTFDIRCREEPPVTEAQTASRRPI